jgi:hypothetical protein
VDAGHDPLLLPTGAAVVGAAVTPLVDELVPVVGLVGAVVVVVGVVVVGVVVVVPVVVVVELVFVVPASALCETPDTRPTTRATAPAVAPDPSSAARRRRRFGSLGGFIPATITLGASGQPHHNVKCVLTSLRSWAWAAAPAFARAT